MPEEVSLVDAFATARADSSDAVPVRMSGSMEDRPDPEKAIGAYYHVEGSNYVYESTGKSWIERRELPEKSITGRAFGLEADRPPAAKMIGWVYEATDTKVQYEAYPDCWYRLTPLPTDMEPAAELRSALSNQFGARLRSTGEAANVAETFVIMQTLDASPENPIEVKFDQHILEAFTGDGQFDLVERDSVRRVFDGVSNGSSTVTSATMNWQPGDEGKIQKVKVGTAPGQYYTILSVVDTDEVTLSGDVAASEIGGALTLEMDGENEVTIATKNGFTDGVTTGAWSMFSKTITTDKVYLVKFVPGTTGDGVFSASARAVSTENSVDVADAEDAENLLVGSWPA